MSYQLIFNYTWLCGVACKVLVTLLTWNVVLQKSKAYSLFLMNEVCMVFNFGGSFYQEATYMVLGLILPIQMAVIISYYVGICYDKLPQNPDLLPWRPTFLEHSCKAGVASVLLPISRNVSKTSEFRQLCCLLMKLDFKKPPVLVVFWLFFVWLFGIFFNVEAPSFLLVEKALNYFFNELSYYWWAQNYSGKVLPFMPFMQAWIWGSCGTVSNRNKTCAFQNYFHLKYSCWKDFQSKSIAKRYWNSQVEDHMFIW